MQAKTRQAKIVTLEQLRIMRYPLPQSLIKAAGLLKKRISDPVRYQRRIRGEWEVRTKKFERQMRAKRS